MNPTDYMTQQEHIRNMLRDLARRNAEQGRAFQALHDPRTGSDLLDRLKMLGDTLLKSKGSLEDIDRFAAEAGMGAVLSAFDHQAKAAIEKRLGRELSAEEFDDLRKIGRRAFANADRSDRTDKGAVAAAEDAADQLLTGLGESNSAAPDDASRGTPHFLKELEALEGDDVGTDPHAPERIESKAESGSRSGFRPPAPDDGFREVAPEGDRSDVSSDVGGAERKDVQNFAAAMANLDEEEAVLLRSVDDWSEADVNRLLKSNDYWSPDARIRTRQRDQVAIWYGLNYANNASRRDQTGRLLAPLPVRAIPKPSQLIVVADGEPFSNAVGALAEALGGVTRSNGAASAIRALQRGLNGLEAAASPKRRSGDPYRVADDPDFRQPIGARDSDRPLKEDGLLGPKTAAATRRGLARHGRKPVEDALRMNAEGSERRTGVPAVERESEALLGPRKPRDGFGGPALLS